MIGARSNFENSIHFTLFLQVQSSCVIPRFPDTNKRLSRERGILSALSPTPLGMRFLIDLASVMNRCQLKSSAHRSFAWQLSGRVYRWNKWVSLNLLSAQKSSGAVAATLSTFFLVT